MRDEQLLALRPVLNLNSDDSTNIEAFQNKTLRPILKYQHELTTCMLKHSTHFSKMKLQISDDEKQYTEIVQKYIGTNIVFKYRLIGAVVGLMTTEEFEFYQENKTELNKRLISMQVQRYVDSRVVGD